ncbi:Na(+)-translocating NADH-quinone reductase subunit C [Raoultella terrigena]|uniref:Na(+)-translocating NADH-quinone reductase subunit C n=1 Tax=Raoultella terrigena TaxID=577 RepID=A0A4U9D9K0_RAOTE|nr:Na(+)-translocating NADH-quinone reductase subunit C [Raoultella terrigena]
MAENKGNDSIGKTLLVVLVLCLVCSIVVAGSAVGLKSRQQEQRELDKQRNILAVSGLMTPRMSADEVESVFAARISSRLVDLASGELLDKDPAKFNQAQALKDPEQSISLEVSQTRRASSIGAILSKFIWCAMSSSRFRK